MSDPNFATPGDAFIIRSGMGNFIESLGKGLDIRLSTPVESITRTPDGVTVRTTTGLTFQTRTVICTVSMGALASGIIQFDPPLPPEYTESFARLPMVNLFKGFLGFRNADAFQALDGFSTVIQIDSLQPTFFTRLWNTNVVEFLSGGPIADSLTGLGREAVIADLLARLEGTYPGCTQDFDGRFARNSWLSNPFTRGAYTGADPGAVPAREILSRPVGRQLWFAGEAVAPGGAHSSLHGAYRTGISTATAALESIGLARAILD